MQNGDMPNDTTLMVILTITHKRAKVNIFLVVLLILYILHITVSGFLYHSLYELSLEPKTQGIKLTLWLIPCVFIYLPE